MFRKLLVAFTALFLMPVLLLAQDGKLRGRVADKESGEPLIGANVTIEGTSLGASTDINGDYIILGVPPGTYSVRGSYIGYSPVTIANIRVGSNITTTQDFSLSSTAIAVDAVEIVADRPLIQRNTTNTVRVATQENIKNLPIRGLQNIVALEAGVVQQKGALHIRGGRAGEVAYFVDGANTTNPIFNSQNVGVIQEAIEELQVQAGGYTAEYGGALSGLVRTTMRTGGSEYRAGIDFQTDDFAKPGSTFLGTTSTGYRNLVATISGPAPLVNNLRFFGAFQHNYTRNRQSLFLEPFRFTGLVTDDLGSYPQGQLLPNGGTVEFKQNYLYNNWALNNTAQGTLLYDFNPFKLRFSGSWEQFEQVNGGSWPSALQFFFNQKKNTLSKTDRQFANVRFTHLLNPTTFYEVGISYQRRYARTYDQDFRHNYLAYPDSGANAALGYTGWTDRYTGPAGYSTIYNFVFAHENSPNNSYGKNSQTQIGATIDFTSQINPTWELKAGGAIESWVYRTYTISNVAGLLNYMDPNRDGVWERTFSSDYERQIRIIQNGAISNVGHDEWGNEVDDGLFAPGEPFQASGYVQNRFEYKDLILNVGARLEYFNPRGTAVKQTPNPQTGQVDWMFPVVDALGVVPEDQLEETQAFTMVLPRISFSFPVTDQTVFYAQYGKFAQMPSLNQMYLNHVTMSRVISAETRSPYNLGGSAIGFTMRPERTTTYEVGLRQSLSENFALTITGFYRDMKDQLQLRRINNSAGIPIFVAFQNEDFGTVKSLEMTFELRRTNRLAARVNYTLSDARGTGSNSRSSQNAVTDEATARFPNYITALDYNQTHKGALMLDYRFERGDGGSVLEGMGLNMLLTFNSGHNYTKIREPQDLGQASPWFIGVRALQDSRSRNPVEPINASTTPWVFNVDLTWSKLFYLPLVNVEIYARVLNLFNTKQVVNVYPTTGTPFDDGWLKSPFAETYKSIALYEAFYRAVNLNNRYAYMSIGGGGLGNQAGLDLYGSPREIRFGVKVEY